MLSGHLIAAIEAAQDDARALFSSELGGRQKRHGSSDPKEDYWYFPPSPAVQAEGNRLCRKFGIRITNVAVRLGPKGQVQTEWLIRHQPSGEFYVMPRETEAFPDSETRSHGIAGAVRHVRRSLYLDLFAIPVRREVKPGEVVVDGAIIPADLAAAVARERADLDAIVGEAPVWMDATPIDEAVAEPGPLPGDEVSGGGPAECARRQAFGEMVDALTIDAETEREQLAPDADAAARGEVREPIDMAALFRRMTAWRAEHGSRGNPRALAGASTSGPLTQEDAAAIDEFLKGEGF